MLTQLFCAGNINSHFPAKQITFQDITPDEPVWGPQHQTSHRHLLSQSRLSELPKNQRTSRTERRGERCHPSPGATAPPAPREDLSCCPGPAEHLPLLHRWFVLCLTEKLGRFPLPDRHIHGVKRVPNAAADTTVQKPPATSWQCHQVKQALGALSKQSRTREGISDVSRSETRPQLLSRSDWLPPWTLTGKGRWGWSPCGDWGPGRHTERRENIFLIPRRLLSQKNLLAQPFFFFFWLSFFSTGLRSLSR